MKSLLLLLLTVAGLAQPLKERYPITLPAVKSGGHAEQTYVIPVNRDNPGYDLYADVDGENLRGIFTFKIRDGYVTVGVHNNTGEDFPAQSARLVLWYVKRIGTDDGDDKREVCEEFPACFPPPPPVTSNARPAAPQPTIIVSAEGVITIRLPDGTIVRVKPKPATLRDMRPRR